MHKDRLRFSSAGPLQFQQHSPWAGGHLGQPRPRGPLSSQCPTHPGIAPARPSALLSLCPLSNGHSQGQRVHRICPGRNFTALFLLCLSFNWVKKNGWLELNLCQKGVIGLRWRFWSKRKDLVLSAQPRTTGGW